jgi:hypothetical protein
MRLVRPGADLEAGASARSQLVLGGGAVRTAYAFRGGNAPESSVSSFGASGLAGLRVGIFNRTALRVDGVADYMPNHEPEANMNLHLRAGISFLLGGSERVVAMVPQTPPLPVRATPPPPPATPAPPREDAIRVCVIDPAAPGGIRMVDATFRQEQRDTVVMHDGQRVPLRQTITMVPTAAQADWYVRGAPMSFTVGTRGMAFHTYMTPRQIDPGMLTYLGRVNGTPVFADRDEAQRFAGELTTARQAQADHDLQAILARNRAIRDAFSDLTYLYVPMQPVGCVFQAMQPAAAAGKGK